MSRSRTLAAIAVLVKCYPRVSLDEDESLAYCEMLNDIDTDRLVAAVKRIVATSKWFPSIAEIRAEALCDEKLLTPPEAWGEVLRGIARWGMNRTPTFDDPSTQRCVAAMGWRNLCLSENAVSDRARFCDMYKQVAAEDREQRVMVGARAGGGELGE